MGKKIVFQIPEGTQPSYCKGCGKQIFWIRTKDFKNMPVDPDGQPHWGSCTHRSQFKK